MNQLISIRDAKRKAKEMKKAEGIPHHEALRRIAQQYGYSSWEALMKNVEKSS